MTSALDNLSGPGKPLGLGPGVWRILAKCHDMRNRGEYEGLLDVNERILADLVAACRALADRLDTL